MLHRGINLAVEDLGLTSRESKIVEAAVIGRTTHRIAEDMSISMPTVRNHLAHVFDKLEIASREELISLLLTRVLRRAEFRAVKQNIPLACERLSCST